MKSIATFACAVVLSSMLGGCLSSADSVRRFAAADLRCPSASVHTQDLGSGTFRASGCGRSGFYLDNNAPATAAFGSSGGGAFFTASAAH